MKRRDTQLRVTKQLTVDTENVQHSESTITNLSQLSLYISDNGAMRVDGNTIIHYGTHLKVPCVFKKILSNVCVRLWEKKTFFSFLHDYFRAYIICFLALLITLSSSLFIPLRLLLTIWFQWFYSRYFSKLILLFSSHTLILSFYHSLSLSLLIFILYSSFFHPGFGVTNSLQGIIRTGAWLGYHPGSMNEIILSLSLHFTSLSLLFSSSLLWFHSWLYDPLIHTLLSMPFIIIFFSSLHFIPSQGDVSLTNGIHQQTNSYNQSQLVTESQSSLTFDRAMRMERIERCIYSWMTFNKDHSGETSRHHQSSLCVWQRKRIVWCLYPTAR